MESWYNMNIKKILLNIVIITIAFLVFVAWYEHFEKRTQQTVTQVKHKLKAYLITTDKEYEYWESVNSGASDMAKLAGIDYVWDAPTERNTEKQIEVLRRAVNSGADAILIAVNDPRKLSGPIEDAKARGIKFVYVDSPAYEEAVTTLATNNLLAGQKAGTAMLDALKSQGIQQGEIGIVGVTPDYDITIARERGFRDVIEKDGNFKLLETIYKNGDPTASQIAAEELIDTQKNLVGLFGTNEGSTEGVGRAIQNKKSNVTGIGFDKTQKNYKLLREGALRTLVVQNPYTMGYLGMAEAIAAMKGYETGPDYINTGVDIIER